MNSEVFKHSKSIWDDHLLKHFLLSDEVTKETMQGIISDTAKLEENHSRLITLASVIKGQKLNYEGGYKHFIVPTAWPKKFSAYMLHWYYIPYARYLFNEWSDIAEEGMTLLYTLISEHNLENYESDERFKSFY